VVEEIDKISRDSELLRNHLYIIKKSGDTKTGFCTHCIAARREILSQILGESALCLP
jgi:hypothetical protein